MSTLSRLATWVVVLMLAGCLEHKPEPPSPVRPVLSVIVAPQTSRTLGFVGTVEPQYRANLGFRVLGRVVARDANVGDLVTKGARLAALDPVALELALRAAQADLSNARAQLANATATEMRQRTLLEKGAATQAQFEAAQQARDAAAAALTRAQANLAKSQEQLGYTQLAADFDGVVTAVEADVGQVVLPGQTVVTIARPDIREAIIDVPEYINESIKPGDRFEVVLQLDPTQRTFGQVREIAPGADPITRTRRIKITLQQASASFRLGTIVTATLTTKVAPQIFLPTSALLERDGKTMVWVVDPSSKTVSSREIKIGSRSEQSVQIAEGLTSGSRVVTAGVNSLSVGQRVEIPDEASQ